MGLLTGQSVVRTDSVVKLAMHQQILLQMHHIEVLPDCGNDDLPKHFAKCLLFLLFVFFFCILYLVGKLCKLRCMSMMADGRLNVMVGCLKIPLMEACIGTTEQCLQVGWIHNQHAGTILHCRMPFGCLGMHLCPVHEAGIQECLCFVLQLVGILGAQQLDGTGIPLSRLIKLLLSKEPVPRLFFGLRLVQLAGSQRPPLEGLLLHQSCLGSRVQRLGGGILQKALVVVHCTVHPPPLIRAGVIQTTQHEGIPTDGTGRNLAGPLIEGQLFENPNLVHVKRGADIVRGGRWVHDRRDLEGGAAVAQDSAQQGIGRLWRRQVCGVLLALRLLLDLNLQVLPKFSVLAIADSVPLEVAAYGRP
mmetsp:Transcript_48025/g.85725  ORF Transcript_48025/g.85725 Transcript_48025/m.85725 type:complete len:361 (+) Transcript_48025:364-1446(+)